MKITDIVTEAANSAQQAAKAIAMKKAGKKPKQGVAEGILGSDPNRGQKVPDWAKGGIVGKIGRHLDPAWSDVQRTVPKHLLAKQPGAAATNAPTTKDTPKSTSATPTRAIPKSTGPKPSQPVTKNVVKTIADKQGVAEGLGNFAKAIDNLHGWYQDDSSDPNIERYEFDDREGGYYAYGTIEHNLKTGEIAVDFEDKSGEYDGDIKATFNSIGDAMNALRRITTQHRYNTGKAQSFDRLGDRTLAGPDDVYKTDRAGKKGTLTKSRMDTMKMSSPYRKTGPKGVLPEQGVAEDTELAEEFDLIESIVEMIAEHNGVDAEVVWADLESLTEDELYVFAVTSDPLMEDWQKANKRDRTDGMSQKAVNAYRRENPGSKLKTAVTTKPGKLKKGGKASKRRKSYCSRSRGQMKMHSISCAKTPDKAICKARRRWNC